MKTIHLVIVTMLIGCGSPDEPAESPVPQASVTGGKQHDDAGPLSDIMRLTSEEIRGRFADLPFSWNTPAIDWDLLTRKERVVGEFVRNEYPDSNARICEAHYGPGKLKMRWQEERRGSEWVRHGPEVYYEQDGGFDVVFRVDGEIGDRISLDKDGRIQ